MLAEVYRRADACGELQFRRVVTRHDKRAVNDLAWVTLAAAIIWL